MLPLVLFLLTCLSTFLTGGSFSESQGDYQFQHYFVWRDGLAYMLAVMSILVAHEMGHYLQALRHGVPASLPFFIPMPLSPIGTMGAVIGMGAQSDRKQLFDIGLTGPLAGLVVAVPVAWYGVMTAVPHTGPIGDGMVAADPLFFQWLIARLRPELSPDTVFAWNPYYMAAWVGLLITGLNMLPVSQLDGGHVAYALFGRRAHLLARAVVAAALFYAVVENQYNWLVMLAVVFFIGIDHPPTSNDAVELGWPRRLLGYASLTIPIFCLAPSLIQ